MNIHDAYPQHYIDADYDTYRCRHELKDLGFKWDAEKKLWWHKSEAERDAAESWLPRKDDEFYDQGSREDGFGSTWFDYEAADW